jgi:hypothetical protein
MSGLRSMTNFGANRLVSDHATYLDDNDTPIGYPQHVEEWIAESTIVEGELVALQAATTTVPEKVAPAATNENAILIIGVALNGASAGQIVRVCTHGVCMALVEAASTPARGDAVVNGGTTAGAAGLDTALDATNVAGSVLGVYLAAKLTSYVGEGSATAQQNDYAPVYVHGR